MEIRSELLDAFELKPARAEALTELAQLHRESGQWHLAHFFAAQASERKFPEDGLFLEESVYAWRALDELALAEFYTGRFEAARDNTRRLLRNSQVSASHRQRWQQNLLHCLARCEGRRPYVQI